MSDSLPPHGLYSPCNSPGQNTGVVSRSLLQGIFPTQELNPSLLWSPAFLQVSSLPVGFPHSSVGKESTCNAGDPGLIPGLGRSSGEGIGYPLQYSWASLVAQLLKNLARMRETWIRSLGWEGPVEKGKATHSSILAWRIAWTI